MTADLDLFKTRLDESNAMKSDWQNEMLQYQKSLMSNERNNGREDVYDILTEIAQGRIYWDSVEDLIQECKIRLKGK